MGLFGGIFKGIKKVAGKAVKVGLSTVTHGASDKVLKVLKGIGGVKAVTKKRRTAATMQEQAIVARADLGSHRPSVQRTESVLQRAGDLAEGKRVGKGGRTGKPKRRRALQGQRTAEARDQLIAERAFKADARRAQRAEKKPKKAKKKRAGPKRQVPKGGLDLAKIAQMWRAEGKPGSWQDYIKANLNVRK